MIRIFSYPLIAILLLVIPNQSQAQVSDSSSQEIRFKPFEVVIGELEKKYNINFFYNPALLEGREIDSRISQLPLSEALAILKNITQLSITKISDFYYVFVSSGSNSNEGQNDDGKYIVVGDLLNYGSKSKITIHGTVIDANNNQSLPGVTINFPKLSKTLTTDVNGKFTLVLPVGENEMKVSYSGFQDCLRTLKVLSDGDLTIELYDKVVNINEVVVAANKIDQNFRRTQMSVMKLQAKNIKELPTTLGEVDVVKSLSLMPGVQTTGEFGSGFNVRGGGSDQNLVLVEDVPLFSTSHLFGLTSILNSDAITSLTLYKGGIPASYGERASSVLNISLGSEELKKPEVKAGISLINSRLNVEIPIGTKLTFMFGGRTTYSDWMLRSIPDADLMNSSAGFNDLYSLISFIPNQKNKLTLFVYDSNDKFSFGGTQNYAYGNLLGSIKFTHHFTNDLFTSLMAGTSFYKARYTENDTLRPAEAYSINNSILYRSLKWNLIWELNEKHVITSGINIFLYNSSPGSKTPFNALSKVPALNMQDEQGIEWAGFISDDFKMSDKLSCEFGIRYSSFMNLGPKKVWNYFPGMPKAPETVRDSILYGKGKVLKTYGGFEPRISVKYNLSSSSSLRFSYNRINQYINLISNTSVQSPSSIWKLSDNYISPVVSDQFAAGFFKDFLNGRYETSLELYYKNYNNVIEYKNGATVQLDPKIETELITAMGRNYGAEIFIKRNTGKLTGWVSYTYSRSIRKTNSKFQSEMINHNTYFPDNLDRPHNLVINSGYYLNKRLRAGFTYTYNTGRPVTLPEMKYYIDGYQVVYFSDKNKYRMPDYERLDLSITRYEDLRIKKKWKGYWTFSVINVLGRRNAYSIFYQKDTDPNDLNRSTYHLYKLYIIGRPLPTFTYNIMF